MEFGVWDGIRWMNALTGHGQPTMEEADCIRRNTTHNHKDKLYSLARMHDEHHSTSRLLNTRDPCGTFVNAASC